MRWPPTGRGGRHPDPEGNERPLARRRRPPPAAACRHAEEVDIGAPQGGQAMTLLLRRQNAQDRGEGREPFGWKDDDFAVLDDETRIGRIYREQLPAGDKRCWPRTRTLPIASTPTCRTKGCAVGSRRTTCRSAAKFLTRSTTLSGCGIRCCSSCPNTRSEAIGFCRRPI